MDSTERVTTQPTSVWRWLVRAAIPVLVLAGGLLVGLALLRDRDPTEVPALVGRILTGVLVTALVFGTIALLNRRGPRARVTRTGRVRDALGTMSIGVLAWLIPAGVMLAIPMAGSSVVLPPQATDAVLAATLLLFAVFFAEALPEEFVFRGHLQAVLLERLEPWSSILVQALVFAAFGVALGGWRGMLVFTLYVTMGLVLGYVRMRVESVWLGIGFHTAFQFGAQAILTHGLIEIESEPWLVMLAIGPVPFTVFAIVGAVHDKPAREAGTRIAG